MDRPDLITELFHQLLSTSFQSPSGFASAVDRMVTRNRTLHSRDRRELKRLLYGAVRWRRRLWGDIAPSRVVLEDVAKRIHEAEALKANPPLARWSTFTMEALAGELSYPTWLLEMWVKEQGLVAAVSLALALNESAPTTLRTNTLKASRDQLIEALAREDVQSRAGEHSPWAVHLNAKRNVRALDVFRKGWCEVQDEGSQLAVLASEVKPGETVVDACTGAGGKVLALAAMMANQGKILATDADSRPLEELKLRAKRSGVKIVDSRWVAQDDPTPAADWKEKADAVLVDAPCSSIGTLRRRPWLKWSLSPHTLKQYPPTQLALLNRYSPLVKPGGRLIYVTCTLHSAENAQLVSGFQESHSEFRVAAPPKTYLPSVEGTDGFFVAVMRR